MNQVRSKLQKQGFVARCGLVAAACLFAGLPCLAQSSKPKPHSPETQSPSWEQELKKYPGLAEELARLAAKIQQQIRFPAAREESRLLPVLPEATIFYSAFPNYGDTANQVLTIFRLELQESAVLRDWWQHGSVSKDGPKLETGLEEFSELQHYLGGEIAVSATMEGREPDLLIFAEVTKPGLKKFLQQLVKEHRDDSGRETRVLDPKELAAATDSGPQQGFVILVRSDFVIGAGELATLLRFNAELEAGKHPFASGAFGKRVAQEYQGGLTTLAAVDFGSILSRASSAEDKNSGLQKSGFGDVKYLVWDHKNNAGEKISETELSFNGPRRGAASWLAKPATLTNLDFVSPKAITASTVVFSNFSQVFDDVHALYATPNSDPFAALPAFEKMLQLSLKDDLLRYLDGELTVELDELNPPNSTWKVIFRINDAAALQKTLSTLLAAGHIETQSMDDGGVTYYTARIPQGKAVNEIGYAFVDGHLILASTREAVADAVRWHASGASLAKSVNLLGALPPGHSEQASALIYVDLGAVAGLAARRVQLHEGLPAFPAVSKPSVMCFYGEDQAIRQVSRGDGIDMGVPLVVAAIAIPNLLRSKIAANEATAVGSVRTVNVAQVTYAATYPNRGYAPDLASLGTDTRNPKIDSPAHANFLDQRLANETCTADAWCIKSGYRLRVNAICKLHLCKEYVVVATPVANNTGVRSFCATSEGVIRYKTELPLSGPVTVTECKTWPALQ